MNESEAEEGDQMLTVFYREKSIVEGSVPLADLKFKEFNQFHSWTKLLKEAESFGYYVNVVSLTQTPKNIGGARKQFMWYEDGKTPHLGF